MPAPQASQSSSQPANGQPQLQARCCSELVVYALHNSRVLGLTKSKAGVGEVKSGWDASCVESACPSQDIIAQGLA